MATPGQFYRQTWGADPVAQTFSVNGANAQAMASPNNGFAVRFRARDTRDIYSVWLNWGTVSSPGTVQVRIETVDSSGKPTGTLYDANASVNITPAAGWQQATFASHPTAGLTADTEYAVVLLTTVGGTTMTLSSHLTSYAGYPTVCLNATDGTTRTNFGEVPNSMPVMSLGLSDGSEEFPDMCPYGVQHTLSFFGAQAAGLKFTVPAGVTYSIAGVLASSVVRTGTPTGDIRVRIFNTDSGNTVVSGSTISLPRNDLLNAGNRQLRAEYGTPVSLAAGTYRLVFDSSGSNVSNCFALRTAAARVAANTPSGFLSTSCPDVTLGSSIVWTDGSGEVAGASLILNDVTGAGSLLYLAGMTGGLE